MRWLSYEDEAFLWVNGKKNYFFHSDRSSYTVALSLLKKNVMLGCICVNILKGIEGHVFGMCVIIRQIDRISYAFNRESYCLKRRAKIYSYLF